MKSHNEDYLKDSYFEVIQFARGEATYISLKLQLWFLKLHLVSQLEIQKALHYTARY